MEEESRGLTVCSESEVKPVVRRNGRCATSTAATCGEITVSAGIERRVVVDPIRGGPLGIGELGSLELPNDDKSEIEQSLKGLGVFGPGYLRRD